jgi:hypothetical protein
MMVTFKSSSKSKLNQLVKVAKELGVETLEEHELTDEEMVLPGPKVSQRQLEKWLSKDDGESYDIETAFAYMKKELAKSKKKK